MFNYINLTLTKCVEQLKQEKDYDPYKFREAVENNPHLILAAFIEDREAQEKTKNSYAARLLANNPYFIFEEFLYGINIPKDIVDEWLQNNSYRSSLFEFLDELLFWLDVNDKRQLLRIIFNNYNYIGELIRVKKEQPLVKHEINVSELLANLAVEHKDVAVRLFQENSFWKSLEQDRDLSNLCRICEKWPELTYKVFEVPALVHKIRNDQKYGDTIIAILESQVEKKQQKAIEIQKNAAVIAVIAVKTVVVNSRNSSANIQQFNWRIEPVPNAVFLIGFKNNWQETLQYLQKIIDKVNALSPANQIKTSYFKAYVSIEDIDTRNQCFPKSPDFIFKLKRPIESENVESVLISDLECERIVFEGNTGNETTTSLEENEQMIEETHKICR